MTDKDGKILNEPEHTFSHSMDAIRYGLASLVKAEKKGKPDIQTYKTAAKEYIQDPDDFSPLTPINDGYKKAEEYNSQADLYLNSL